MFEGDVPARNGALGHYVLERVAAQGPHIAICDRSHRGTSLVIVQKSKLAKADHREGSVRLLVGLDFFDEVDVRLEVPVLGIGPLVVDSDFADSLCQHEVFLANVAVFDDFLPLLCVLFEHRVCQHLKLGLIEVFGEKLGLK